MSSFNHSLIPLTGPGSGYGVSRSTILPAGSVAPQFIQLAAKIGLSAPKLRRSLASEIYWNRIDLDFQGGIRSGVNGTPTFFINDVRHDGSFDFDTLLMAIAEVN